MRFNILIVLTSALATAVSADQKAANSELSSLAAAQITNSAWIAVQPFFATKTAASKSFDAVQSSISSIIANSGTIKVNYLDSVPTEVRSFYSSFVDAQVSIVAKNGYAVAIEGKTAAKGAASSTKPLCVGAVVVAGFLGALVIL